MKHNFLKGIFLNLVGMISSATFSGGIECKICPCPEGLNYIAKTDCNIRIPGLFCKKSGRGIQGWSISNEAQTILIV